MGGACIAVYTVDREIFVVKFFLPIAQVAKLDTRKFNTLKNKRDKNISIFGTPITLISVPAIEKFEAHIMFSYQDKPWELLHPLKHFMVCLLV